MRIGQHTMCPFKSCYFIFIVFLLGPFLTHAELPAYLYYILTHGAAFEHLSGYLLLLLLFVFWLVAFCQRYYRLVFFDVYFL